MVKCKDCGQEMTTSTSCTYPYIKLDGKWYKRNTSYYDLGKAGQGRCHDCGIKNHGGHIHHYGCDIERCPKCKGQLLSCNCKHRQIAQTKPSSNLKSQIKSSGISTTATWGSTGSWA